MTWWLVWVVARPWDRPDTGVAAILWGGAPIVMPRGLGTLLNLVKNIMPRCCSRLHISSIWWLCFRVRRLVDLFVSRSNHAQFNHEALVVTVLNKTVTDEQEQSRE
jgi:hypothetical protein